MQSAGIGIGWLWILGPPLLALLGLFLLWRGLHPRRVGTTPYCCNCGYNLTGTDRGAEGTRCPECGADVTSTDAVVLGECIRRWGRVFAGLIILLVAVVCLVGIAIGVTLGVNWYQYEPTAWLLTHLQSGSRVRVDNAFDEITRRWRADALSPTQVARLAEICLDEQGRRSTGVGAGPKFVDFLGKLYESGQLTEAQRERLFENAVCITRCTLRPRIIRGAVAALTIAYETRLPHEQLHATIRAREIRCGNDVVFRNAVLTTASGYGGCAASAPWDGLDSAGQHVVSIDLEVDIGDDLSEFQVTGTPLHRAKKTFTVPVEVLSERPPDYVRLVSSPELDADVQNCVSIRNVHATMDSTETRRTLLSFTVHAGPNCRTGLAFEVLVRYDGNEVQVGTVTASKDAPAEVDHLCSGMLPAGVPATLEIILRSSPAAAERTVDLFEIWGGELQFEIDLEHPEFTRPAAIHRTHTRP